VSVGEVVVAAAVALLLASAVAWIAFDERRRERRRRLERSYRDAETPARGDAVRRLRRW
jgi:hypothetical protein